MNEHSTFLGVLPNNAIVISITFAKIQFLFDSTLFLGFY